MTEALTPEQPPTYPTCDAQWLTTPQDGPRICRRRAEWRIVAVDHDGEPYRQWLACNDTMCRGQAAARAWQERDVAGVEVRLIDERH